MQHANVSEVNFYPLQFIQLLNKLNFFLSRFVTIRYPLTSPFLSYTQTIFPNKYIHLNNLANLP